MKYQGVYKAPDFDEDTKKYLLQKDNFKKYRVFSEKLSLRPFAYSDFDSFYYFINTLEAKEYLKPTKEQLDKEGARNFLKAISCSYHTNEPVLIFIIENMITGEFMGGCGLVKENNDMNCFYVLLPKFWGKGFGVESLKLLFKIAFDNNIEAINAKIDIKNQRAVNTAINSSMVEISKGIFQISKK